MSCLGSNERNPLKAEARCAPRERDRASQKGRMKKGTNRGSNYIAHGLSRPFGLSASALPSPSRAEASRRRVVPRHTSLIPLPPVKSSPIATPFDQIQVNPTQSNRIRPKKIYFSSPISDFGPPRPPPKIKNYQTNPFSEIHNPITSSALRKFSRPTTPKTNPFSTPWLPTGYQLGRSWTLGFGPWTLTQLILPQRPSCPTVQNRVCGERGDFGPWTLTFGPSALYPVTRHPPRDTSSNPDTLILCLHLFNASANFDPTICTDEQHNE